MKRPKRKYHVRIFTRTYDDDGMLECEQMVYEQDTWAVSEKQAECNVRHNSGIPFHGNMMAEGGHWSRWTEAEVLAYDGAGQ